MTWNMPQAFHHMPDVQEVLYEMHDDLSVLLLRYMQDFPRRAGMPEVTHVHHVYYVV
jgi:hypothetical protein